MLAKSGLHPFEVAQLSSLLIRDPNEAYDLIPSLNPTRVPPDALDLILKDLESVRLTTGA